MTVNNIDYFSEQIKNRDISKSVLLKKSNLRDFGLSKSQSVIVQDLKELKSQPPNIVIAQCVMTAKYVQNNAKEQEFIKKQRYIMSIDMFESMQYDARRKYKKSNKNIRILKPAVVKFKNIFRRYNGEDLTNKTLLIWRTGGIGDLLFIKPNLDYLKEKYPTCKIKFACGPQYQSMIDNWDCVDKIIDLPFNFKHLVTSDYHCIFEGVIERTLEARKTNAYELFTQWMNLNLPVDKLIPKQKPKEELVRECENILYNKFVKKNNFILMQVRASSPPRTPNPSFWAKMIDKLADEGHTIVLTDMPSQEENLEKLKNLCKNKDNIIIFAKESKSVAHLIALTSLAKLTISPDSSLVHIAESVNTKSFAVYGPFTGKVRLSTYKNNDWVDSNYKCAPCFIHNHRPCKNSILGYSPCYNTIEMDECIEKINRLLNG